MTTTAEIKAALLAELSADLGTYTFSGGQVTPAIRVEDGGSPYNEEPTPAGLEIVIMVSPEISMQPMLGGWQDTYTWLIILKQWNIGSTTLPYRGKLMNVLSSLPTVQATGLRRLVRQTNLDTIETMSVQLTELVWVEDDY